MVKSSEEHSVKSDELNSVLKEIHSMRDRHDSISTIISRLNRWEGLIKGVSYEQECMYTVLLCQ